MPGSAYNDPPSFVPNQTLTASQMNAVGDAIRALKWWTAAGSIPYAFDADQLEELLTPVRASILQHNATVPSWLTLAASGIDKYKVVRVNASGNAFELGAGGITVAAHNNATGHSYSTNAWRDMPNSSKVVTVNQTSTIVVFGVIVNYGTGTYGFRNFKINIDGTDVDTHISAETYGIGENQSTPVIGLKTGVSAGSKTIKLREISNAAGHTVDNLFYIVLIIPE
jgi:hypothetical protein